MLNLTRTADYLAKNLEDLGFIVMSQRSGAGLPLVAVRMDEDLGKQYDEFAMYVSPNSYLLAALIHVQCPPTPRTWMGRSSIHNGSALRENEANAHRCA